jgi:hypothetical protein
MSKKLLLIMGLLLTAATVFAQGWTRDPLRDRWGDVMGDAFTQIILSAKCCGDRDIPVAVGVTWVPAMPETLVIVSEAIDRLTFHPAYSFMDEYIKVSLRSNGITTTYNGSTFSSKSIWQNVVMIVFDQQLINQLHGSGQWDVLIEGDDWYISTTIRENLPKE